MAITTNGKVSITNLQVGSSADLAGIISDESGTGVLAFTNSPSFTTPALGTPSAVTLTNATGLPVSGITASTSSAIGVGSVELGHATDTTIARVSAGVVSIEGVNVVTTSSTDTLTNKTLTSPVISTISNTGTLTLPTSTGTLALTTDIPAGGVTETGTQTLTNKTLTSPIVSGLIVSDASIILEGATANNFETTLTVTDPTADRTITFPDATGTVALTSDITVTASSTDTLTNKTLTDAKINLAINGQTGTTYTFALTDNGKFVTASNASAITVTIPPASSVAYATGAQINIIQKGAGQVTFAQGSGVTIRSVGATATAPALRAQYSSATCVYEGSDVWYVVGDIV